MKLFSPAWLDKHYSKVMIGAIFIYFLPFLIMGALVVMWFLTPPAPRNIDFVSTAQDVVQIEMVEWPDSTDPTTYNLAKTISDKDKIPLLTDLSNLDFHLMFFLSAPYEVKGDCFRITYLNNEVHFVCRSGLAKFPEATQSQVYERKYSGLSVRLEEFELFWDKILNQK